MAKSNGEMLEDVDSEGVSKELSIEFYDPNNVNLTFVDNLAILYSEDRFILSFFQAEPPLVIEPGSGTIEAVKSKCMVRMVVTPKSMTHMYKSIEQAFKTYQAQHEKNKGGGEDSNV